MIPGRVAAAVPGGAGLAISTVGLLVAGYGTGFWH